MQDKLYQVKKDSNTVGYFIILSYTFSFSLEAY